MLVALTAAFLSPDPAFLERTHSHNDYAQERPLQEALDNRFASVEADVFLVDGRLLVGHNREDLKPERNLVAMYLQPISDQVKANGGWVYPKVHKVFWVLIDIKENGAAVYEELKKEIGEFPNLGYRARNTNIRFVVSGDRPVDSIVRDEGKFAGLDGRWGDLDKGYSKELMPWVSEDWSDHFKWMGPEPMPGDQEGNLLAMVKRVHDQGRRIRFWGAPDSEAIWSAHWKAGVDFVNTDHLAALRKWMLGQR